MNNSAWSSKSKFQRSNLRFGHEKLWKKHIKWIISWIERPQMGGCVFVGRSVGRSVGDNFFAHTTRLYAGYTDAARRLRRNDIFVANALEWKPDIFHEPWCKYYLCKYEVKVFRSHYRRNMWEKRRLWPDVQCGKELLSLKISDRELMQKLKIIENECAIWDHHGEMCLSWKSGFKTDRKFQSQQFQFTKTAKFHSKKTLSAWEWGGCGTGRKKSQIFCGDWYFWTHCRKKTTSL